MGQGMGDPRCGVPPCSPSQTRNPNPARAPPLATPRRLPEALAVRALRGGLVAALLLEQRFSIWVPPALFWNF